MTVPAAFDPTGAVCAETDPELFFPERGGKPDAAKRLCADCPLRAACLDYALAADVSGVWGGTTEVQRRAIRARRRQPVAA